MKYCIHTPQDTEIKFAAFGKWEPLPDNARVDMCALNSMFELVVSVPGVFDERVSLYDVRDNLCSSWHKFMIDFKDQFLDVEIVAAVSV